MSGAADDPVDLDTTTDENEFKPGQKRQKHEPEHAYATQLDALAELGYSTAACQQALDACNGDVAVAAECLLSATERPSDAEFARQLQEKIVAEAHGVAAAGPSKTGGHDPRPRCWWGYNCYRKDSAHLQSFRHDLSPTKPRAQAQCATGPPPPRRVFDAGREPLHLNRLGGGAAQSAQRNGGQPGSAAQPLPPSELTKADLLWHAPFLQHALFASFGVDYSFLRSMLQGSPATGRPGGVTIVAGNEHMTEAAGAEYEQYAPWSVVMPPFYEDKATAQERLRVERGTMHPKLWLLELQGDGEAAPFLRVGIFSANLGAYDLQLNNQFWVHDFPRRTPSGAAAELAAVPTSDAPMDSPPPPSFGRDLNAFVGAMLRPAPELQRAWTKRLATYDLTPPSGVHLISSVPGRRSEDAAYVHGARGLGRILASELRRRSAAARHSHVEFAVSSIGRLEKMVWEPLCKEFLKGSTRDDGSLRGAMAMDEAPRDADDPPVRLVWPSMATMLATMERSESGREWWRDEHGPIGPGEEWDKGYFPAHSFVHHVMPWQHRARTYHHCKIAAGWSESHELVWMYAGSHNCSGAAWGKPERTIHDTWEQVIMSYELGVLYVPPAPIAAREARKLIPWQTPARRYSPDTVPYSLHAVQKQMVPESPSPALTPTQTRLPPPPFLALQIGSGQFESTALHDIAAAAAAARAACPSPLPTLLLRPLGDLRLLMMLQVSSPNGSTLHPSLPRPPSSRAGHLKPDDIALGTCGGGRFHWRVAARRGVTHGFTCVRYVAGEFVPHPRVSCGRLVLVLEAATYTFGTTAKPQPDARKVIW